MTPEMIREIVHAMGNRRPHGGRLIIGEGEME